MDVALRELSDQIDQATQRLLGTARIITDPELRVPSLLPGWTRGHVLAHVARNADGMRNVLVGVRAGQDRPAYASAGEREAAIEQDAGTRATEHAADLADSAMALRTVARQLPDKGWQVPVRMLEEGDVFPAAELLTRRLVEVELHHCDLGAGYGLFLLKLNQKRIGRRATRASFRGKQLHHNGRSSALSGKGNSRQQESRRNQDSCLDVHTHKSELDGRWFQYFSRLL